MAVSKEEYLKRYMSDDKSEKRKSRPTAGESAAKARRLKIIDADAPVALPTSARRFGDDDDDDLPVLALLGSANTEELTLLGKFKTDSFKELRPAANDPQTSKEGGKKRQRHDSGSSSDASPPRRRPPPRADSDADLSPPRARRRKASEGSDSDASVERRPAARTLEGKRAGLQSAKALRVEADRIRRNEEKVFARIDECVSGKNAETVFRDKGGKRRDLKQERETSQAEQQKRKELEDKYKKWNKGLKQLSEREGKLEELAHEVNKPLTRLAGDVDLEKHLKEQTLRDDPMLAFIKKKKVREQARTGVVYPAYAGPLPAPNRYGIAPGYRWDGVDRSNGFEAKLMSQGNLRKAQAEELYKWQMGSYE